MPGLISYLHAPFGNVPEPCAILVIGETPIDQLDTRNNLLADSRDK